jgi:hypothetical protein
MSEQSLGVTIVQPVPETRYVILLPNIPEFVLILKDEDLVLLDPSVNIIRPTTPLPSTLW